MHNKMSWMECQPNTKTSWRLYFIALLHVWLVLRTCMATGKSPCASGGKNTSTAFFWNGWLPWVGVPTSIMWSCKRNYIGLTFAKGRWSLTFPPCWFLTANVKRVDSEGLPGNCSCANAAACPSMGWLTPRSTEYSCIAPATLFCCDEIKFT